MPVLDKLSSSLGRNDEVPNQELARELAESGDAEAIQELVANLKNKKLAIANDCIKVLYEIGEREPRLIGPYVNEFIDLLFSKNNRLVWGGMTALGWIAALVPDAIWSRVDEVRITTDRGSAITKDWGIRVTAAVAAAKPEYHHVLFPYLLDFLRACPAKDVPRHAESAAVAAKAGDTRVFLALLREREAELAPAQLGRVKKLAQSLGG